MKYREHNEAMRDADRRFEDERDRRYSVENDLRAMALRIKETADAKALDLASQIQTYKDDKVDKNREQNLTERGAYVTHTDLKAVFEKSEENLATVFKEIKFALKPMIDHIAADKGTQLTITRILGYIIALGVIIGIVFSFLNYVLNK